MRHRIMLRSPDAFAPATPAGITLTGNTLAWDASSDPYTPPAGGSGLREYRVYRNGVYLASVPTTPGLSLELAGADVGGFTPAGSNAQSGASYTLTAAGNEIYGTSDQFHYVSAPFTADCSITAQLTAFNGSWDFAKCGLMFRDSSAANAAYVILCSFPFAQGQGIKLEYRATTGASAQDATVAIPSTAARWLKLTRVGSTFSAYYSFTGSEWTLLGTVGVVLGASARVGLALSSQNAGVADTVTFNNVAIANVARSTYTVSDVVDPPSQISLLETRFSGLDSSLTYLGGYRTAGDGSGEEWRFNGTDNLTGQVFSATSPKTFNSSTNPSQRLQILNFTPGSQVSDMWTWGFGNDGNPYFQIRPIQSQVGVSQFAYRLYNTASWENSGMVYQRIIMKFDPTWPTTSDGYIGLLESKIDGGTSNDAKIELAITRESGVWYLRCSTNRNGQGDTGIWVPTEFGPPEVNSDPVQDSVYSNGTNEVYFSKGVGAYDPSGAAPDFTRFYKFEFAYRPKDLGGNVYGNTGTGWVWAASASSTTYDGAVAANGSQRFYIVNENIHQRRTPGQQGYQWIFPLMYYSNQASANKWLRYYYCEVNDSWPSDASSHPVGAI